MVNIDVLKKGDEVLSINERFLAVKRNNGVVDIYAVFFTEENELTIDPVKTTVIGFGDGLVSKKLDDGETTIFTF